MKPITSYILGLILGCIGSLVGLIAIDNLTSRPNLIPPLPFTMGTIKARPIDIRLKIVSQQEFNKSADVKQLMVTQSMSGVGAYTELNTNPCIITIPDDFEIFFIAALGGARFSNPSTGDTIAHEILHCLYGSWHPPWNVIQSKSNLVQSKANALPH